MRLCKLSFLRNGACLLLRGARRFQYRMTKFFLVVVSRALEIFGPIAATATFPHVKKLLLRTQSRASGEVLRTAFFLLRFTTFCFTTNSGEKNCQIALANFCLKTYSARFTGVSAWTSVALNKAGIMQRRARSALRNCQIRFDGFLLRYFKDL